MVEKCENCGNDLSENDDFCPKCGTLSPKKKREKEEKTFKKVEEKRKAEEKRQKRNKFLKDNKIKLITVILVIIVGISTFYYFTYIHIDNEKFYAATKEIPSAEVIMDVNKMVSNNKFVLGGYESYFERYNNPNLANLDAILKPAYERTLRSAEDSLNSQYGNLTLFKTKFRNSIDELEKTATSKEEKKFVSLVKQQYTSFVSLMENIDQVHDNNYSEKIDSKKLHQLMLDTKEIHIFLDNHSGFTSKYKLESIDDYEMYSQKGEGSSYEPLHDYI